MRFRWKRARVSARITQQRTCGWIFHSGPRSTRWRSTDPSLKRLLEQITQLGPGYYPNRDEAMARAAVNQLEATIVAQTPSYEYVPGRVYAP